MSVRFIKFALVGASGTVVNLCAFSCLTELSGIRDWRISGLATLFANLVNYVSNNAWTFVDRAHSGWSLLRGYASYLGLSLVGLLASTLTFAWLTQAHDTYAQPLHSSTRSFLLVLGFQLVAILVGTVFNYKLNSHFTWREQKAMERKFSGLRGISRNRCVLQSRSALRERPSSPGHPS